MGECHSTGCVFGAAANPTETGVTQEQCSVPSVKYMGNVDSRGSEDKLTLSPAGLCRACLGGDGDFIRFSGWQQTSAIFWDINLSAHPDP